MNDNPLMILLYVGIAAYVGFLYFEDWKANRSGQSNPNAMPGAVSAKTGVYVIGIIGALLILAGETAGEIVLGVVDQQSEMIWFFVFASIAAGIIEEVIFRGYLVVQSKGRAALIGSCIGFSLIFALIHPHLWSMDDGFEWTLTSKGLFTTAILFINSLWFYALRFGPWNPSRSIFPCMIAHAISNLGVFFVKLAQGYVIF